MSFKKMALNGLAILSLTLMASSTGWSTTGSGNDFEDKMGKEFTQTAVIVMQALPGTLNEPLEKSGDDLSVCMSVANLGFMTHEKVLELAESVFAEKPSPSSERQALLAAIYCLTNDKYRAKHGFPSQKESSEAQAILVTNSLLEVKVLNKQLSYAAQGIEGPIEAGK